MGKYVLKNKMVKTEYANNLIGILLLIQPLLNSYSISDIPGSLSDISIIIIMTVWLLWIIPRTGLDLKKGMMFFIPYMAYILINWVVIATFSSENVSKEYLRMFSKYILLLTLILPNIKMNYWIQKWFSILSFFLALYCVLQYVAMNFLRVYLPSYLPFLNFREDLKNEIDYLNYTWFYRPHSIFQEPAHFGEFILVYLALLLFGRESNIKNYILRIFASATILLTGSTTGVVGVLVLWGGFMVLNVKPRLLKKSLVSCTIVMPIALITVIRTVFNSNSFIILLQRVFMSGAASESRFGNLKKMFDMEWNLINIIFGHGYRYHYFANKIGWLPSYAMIFLYFGIIGVLLFIMALIGICFQIPKSKLSKVLLVLFVILNSATEMFFDMHVVMYLFVIFGWKEKAVYDKLPQG